MITEPMSLEMKRPGAPGRFEPCMSGYTSLKAIRDPVYGCGSCEGIADSSNWHSSRKEQLCHV